METRAQQNLWSSWFIYIHYRIFGELYDIIFIAIIDLDYLSDVENNFIIV